MKTIYNKNVGIVILLLGFYQWMGAQPSTNQNYIQTRTMTDSTGTKSLDLIQYFDGLGRPVQQVQVGFTPNKADFVAFQEYDAFGREWKNWLPVNTTGSNGNFRTIQSLKDRTDTAYGTEPARYSETVYEPSPLNRVEKQYGPGQDWQEDNNGEGHPVKIEYLTNNATYPCAYYYISGNNLVKNSNYANNQLFVTKMTDEDGKVAYEFKDKLGQVVLQRQVNGTASNTTTNHDTHYVYDDFGNLRYVLPPTLSDLATSDTSYPESNDYAKQLAYIYKYDKRNRCSEKKLPGADPVYYVYDKADRLIFSQDGEQRPGNDWTFYKYDAFNRIILTGVWKNSAKTQENLTNQYQDSLATAQPGSGAYGYTWTTLAWVPSTAVLQANYYDNSDSFLNTLNSTTKAKINYSTPPTGYDARYANSKGLLVGTLVKMLDDTSKEIACAFYYDAKGRVVQQKSTNLLGGSEVEYYAYSFTGNPTKKQKVHTATGKSDITENYTYDYDHANRPTITTYQLGSNTAITLSLLTYDELGRVKEKKLHGTKETINYTYNIRNWLKGINSANFKETLYYQDGSTPLYNGNISRLSWQSVNSSEMQSYQFTYDPLNRLTNTSYTPSASLSAYAKESLMYDKMGNIKALRRTRHTASGTSFTLIPFDNLTLTYTGNQLKKITDASDPSEGFIKPTGTAPTIEYGYNKNGAMTSDFNRNITNIRYNVLNLPDTILFKAGHSTRYSYDAAGMKRRTIHTTVVSKVTTKLSTGTASNMGTTNSLGTTSSVGGIATLNPPVQAYLADEDITDYCGNIIYENGALKYILTPEGYVTKSGSTIIYNYYLRDHLGNNRVVMAVNGNNYTAVQKTDYYPSGMPFENGLAPEKQPYKFGGKELDEMHGLNTYDQVTRQFGAVRYSTDTMDPMLEKYYSVSPYSQMGNNPVRYVDPTGEAWRATYDEDHNGNITYNGYEWVEESESYNNDGTLKNGLYAQAIFFSNNGTFDASSSYNMGSSTATVYLADGTTTTFDANTNPSSSDYATVPEGIYQATVGKHKGDYDALKMRDVDATSQTIELGQANPAHPERTYATGINIHKPGDNNKTGMTTSGKAISQGCLLIDINNWDNFIGNFNTDAQRSNTVSVTVSRSMATPANVNRLPAFNFFMSGTRRSFFSPF